MYTKYTNNPRQLLFSVILHVFVLFNIDTSQLIIFLILFLFIEFDTDKTTRVNAIIL